MQKSVSLVPLKYPSNCILGTKYQISTQVGMQTNILPQSVSLQVQSAIQNSLLRSLHFQFFLPSAGAGRSSGLQPQWSRQALRGPKQAIPAFLIEIPLLARATQDRNKIEQSNMQSSHWKKKIICTILIFIKSRYKYRVA